MLSVCFILDVVIASYLNTLLSFSTGEPINSNILNTFLIN